MLVGAIVVGWADARCEARWHLDIATGAFVTPSDVEFRRGPIEVDTDIGNGGTFVIGGGYLFADRIDVAAQLQTATNFDLFDDSVTVYSLTTGVRVFPLPKSYPIRPWLGGQLGWYRADGEFNENFIFDDDDDDINRTDDSFGINVGGGLDVPVGDRVSLGVDIRYHNAFDAFGGFEFVTTLINVSIWFGDP